VEVTGKKAVSIDLDANELTAGSEDDLLDGVERARGGAGDDKLTGSAGNDGLFGGGGNDTIDGGAGDDYLGGDLGFPRAASGGAPGVDSLSGGAGDDVLDGRDDAKRTSVPTDRLDCGDGARDRIIGQPDDLVTGCEFSEWGRFIDDPVDYRVEPAALSTIAPVAERTYRIACPAGHTGPCAGNVTLEAAPATRGTSAPPTVWGRGAFVIQPGTTNDVEVVMNEEIPAGATVAVHVQGNDIDFGWQP
jgi:Ca2+-binding RTX toxin-like protein